MWSATAFSFCSTQRKPKSIPSISKPGNNNSSWLVCRHLFIGITEIGKAASLPQGGKAVPGTDWEQMHYYLRANLQRWNTESILKLLFKNWPQVALMGMVTKSYILMAVSESVSPSPSFDWNCLMEWFGPLVTEPLQVVWQTQVIPSTAALLLLHCYVRWGCIVTFLG